MLNFDFLRTLNRRLIESGLVSSILVHISQITKRLHSVKDGGGPTEDDLKMFKIMDPISQILLKISKERCPAFLEVTSSLYVMKTVLPQWHRLVFDLCF